MALPRCCPAAGCDVRLGVRLVAVGMCAMVHGLSWFWLRLWFRFCQIAGVICDGEFALCWGVLQRHLVALWLRGLVLAGRGVVLF